MMPGFIAPVVVGLIWKFMFNYDLGILNYLLNANYMYLCAKPPVDNALLIGEWPFYILAMEFIAGLMFIALLLPFKLKSKFLN